MSDDEADPELLALLRQHYLGKPAVQAEPEIGILKDAESVYDDSIDVAIDMRATKAAAASVHAQMQRKQYSTASWSANELHPKPLDPYDEDTLNFVFTIDLLNYSFWSELPHDERFAIEYQGRRWTGYWSLVAALRRALDVEEEGSDEDNTQVMQTAGQENVNQKDDETPGDNRPPGNSNPIDIIEVSPDGESKNVTNSAGQEEDAELEKGTSDSAEGDADIADKPMTGRPTSPSNEMGASDANTQTPSNVSDTVRPEAVVGDDPPKTEGPTDPNDGSSHDNGDVSEDTTMGDDAPAETSIDLPKKSWGRIPITSPAFWDNEQECTLEALRHVFRSATDEEIPLLEERLACLREAGRVIADYYDGSVANLIRDADGSAARLVNMLARDFSCFRDEHRFDGIRRPIRLMKRAQIFVADVWACFDGQGFGAFRDIDKITMFADYRVPQILNSMGCLYYSPSLMATITSKKSIEVGSRWEVQLRACSIWCVELLKREILKQHPDTKVNAILIDFFLYDTIKEMEAAGTEPVPHHRSRSIWY